MATTQISSVQASPSTTFELWGDVVETDTTTGDGRWRIRFYLHCENGPSGSTSSQYGGSGTQTGKANGTAFGSHSGNPFLPSGYANGATRWTDGPWDVWVNANVNGYWAGTSTSYPVQMTLAYGSINITPTGDVTLPRILQKPDAPAAPTVGTRTSTSLPLSWSAPSDTGGSAITGYSLDRATASDFSSGLVTTALGAVTSYTPTGLTPNTSYWFRIRAINAQGTSPNSASLATSTLATVPDPPTGVTAVGTAPDTITMSWTAPAYNGGSAITGYSIDISTASDFSSSTTYTTTGLTIDLKPLLPSTKYYTRVSAVNAIGQSTKVAPGGVTTPAGVYVSNGTTWQPCVVSVDNGTVFITAVSVQVSNGSAWIAAI